MTMKPNELGTIPMTNCTVEKTQLLYAKVAGFAYLLIIITPIIKFFFVESNLIVSGNNATTASNIMANEFLFRICIACDLIMYTSVVLLSLALYVILKTVNKNLALLALLFRSGEAIVGFVTVFGGLIALLLLDREDYLTAFGTEQFQTLVGLFLDIRTVGLDIVLILVGLGGTLFCYLFFKSKYVPKILAVWGVFTYLSMLGLAFINILLPDRPAMIEIVIYTLGTFFELIFGFWLVLKGLNVQQRNKHVLKSDQT